MNQEELNRLAKLLGHQAGHQVGDVVKEEAGPTVSTDAVDHPKHYNVHPSGIECIDIVEHMSFNLGNAVKYIWRAGLKSDDVRQELEKARWYVERELSRLASLEK